MTDSREQERAERRKKEMAVFKERFGEEPASSVVEKYLKWHAKNQGGFGSRQIAKSYELIWIIILPTQEDFCKECYPRSLSS